MTAIRRIAVTIGALVASLALVFSVASSASAYDDFGISPQGFNGWQYDDCTGAGALHFQHLAYRLNGDTITFQFWVGDDGRMNIQADTPGAVNNQHRVYQLGLGRVWYEHITARLHYKWSLSWWPDTGGSCTIFTPAL
jgi:hypothetical protein